MSQRLQENQNVPGVAGGADVALSNRGQYAGDIRVGPDDIDDLLLMPRHLVERDPFRRLGVTNDATRIVVGNKSFGNHVKEEDRDNEQNSADQDCEGTMLQGDLQRPAITSDQPFIGMLGFLPPCAFWWFGLIGISVIVRLCTLPNGRVSAKRICGRQWFASVIVAMAAERIEDAAAQHRRETQRDKSRNQDGDTNRDCEFSK